MKLGIAYYPEHHKSEEWSVDLEKIQKGGLKRIRIGEFAWSRLEPEKGKYEWKWLDDSIELAAKYSIEVVLCTPTACPPIWLVEEYPEVLPVNESGIRMTFGKRQHRCYNSPIYQEYSAKIVEALGKRYGSHPNVVAWQLDNEFGGERKRCYCDCCRRGFQKYLADKYSTIDELNKRWGNHFWSQDYQTWEQIPSPFKYDGELSLKHHPSLELEFSRFSSQSIVKYSRMQVSILKKYVKDSPITTNTDTFYYGDNVNLLELFRDLDIGGIDVYSENMYEIGFYADMMRSLKSTDRFWMMEYSAESKNLGKEMELLKSHGCEWMLFFKLNPFPWGQEQGTRGLLTLTGEPRPNYFVIKKWAEKEKENANSVGIKQKPKVGLFYHFDSSWAYSITSWQPSIVERSIYPVYLIHTVYRSLFEENLSLQFVFTEDGIQGLETLILPWQILYDEDLEKALIHFVRGGRKLIVTSDLFQKNADNVYLTRVPKIYKLLFDWQENNFIYPANEPRSIVIRTKKTGPGQAWMIRRDTTLDEWKKFLKEVK